MKKITSLLFVCSFVSINVIAQGLNEKMLFVIDSIPIINDMEEWNQLLQDDIADLNVIRSKDSLKNLGWGQLDGITYIFTKAYRNRPDSIKRIPGLKQMQIKNGAWHFHGSPYNGTYIDYYNSGGMQNKGILANGRLNGELTVYFKNGAVKSVSNYKDGVLHGVWNEYYINGALMQSREFVDGRSKPTGKIYFVNGQVQNEIKPKRETHYDTAFTYYSSGKVKQLRLIRNNVLIPDKKADDFIYYTQKFYQSINANDIKEANKVFFKTWQIDSSSIESHFMEGLLMMKEFRFPEAIDAFDLALRIEPLMRESIVHRALARIKQRKYPNAKLLPKDFREPPLTINDVLNIPENEKQKICKDLEQAKYVDYSEYYLIKLVPPAILNYCGQNVSR